MEEKILHRHPLVGKLHGGGDVEDQPGLVLWFLSARPLMGLRIQYPGDGSVGLHTTWGFPLRSETRDGIIALES